VQYSKKYNVFVQKQHTDLKQNSSKRWTSLRVSEKKLPKKYHFLAKVHSKPCFRKKLKKLPGKKKPLSSPDKRKNTQQTML
jgi:hypothetical protein